MEDLLQIMSDQINSMSLIVFKGTAGVEVESIT